MRLEGFRVRTEREFSVGSLGAAAFGRKERQKDDGAAADVGNAAHEQVDALAGLPLPRIGALRPAIGEARVVPVVTALVQHGAGPGMLREISRLVAGKGQESEVASAIQQAMKGTNESADVVGLAAAYYWNTAVVLRHWKRPWRGMQERAIQHGARAYKRDPTIASRSPFIKMTAIVHRRM